MTRSLPEQLADSRNAASCGSHARSRGTM
jgi:hypothetical protein